MYCYGKYFLLRSFLLLHLVMIFCMLPIPYGVSPRLSVLPGNPNHASPHTVRMTEGLLYNPSAQQAHFSWRRSCLFWSVLTWCENSRKLCIVCSSLSVHYVMQQIKRFSMYQMPHDMVHIMSLHTVQFLKIYVLWGASWTMKTKAASSTEALVFAKSTLSWVIPRKTRIFISAAVETSITPFNCHYCIITIT
jgi:hypothetical protein